MGNQVVVRGVHAPIPAPVAAAGENTRRRFIEFFTANIRNLNTRAAYLWAVADFFRWCEEVGLGQLDRLEPVHRLHENLGIGVALNPTTYNMLIAPEATA